MVCIYVAGAELQYMDQDFEEWTGLLSHDELSEALSVRPNHARLIFTYSFDARMTEYMQTHLSKHV